MHGTHVKWWEKVRALGLLRRRYTISSPPLMLLLGFLLLATRSSGYALLPRQDNLIPQSTPQDVSDMCSTCPEMRTLISILWSCFSTLVVATWVSVHPNVPPPGSNFFRMAIIRSGLMIATILAPEVTLSWAFVQKAQASEIHLNPKFQVQGRPWTKTHAFYLLMGGFALYQGKDRYGALTPGKLEALLDNDLIDMPDIDEEDILDKSKGDWVAKTIAIVQMLWFTAQFIARYVKGWAATELEILTLSTTVMTIGMYYSWWHKPLDVRCQTKVYLKVAADVFFEAPELSRAVPIQGSHHKPSLLRKIFTDPITVSEDNSTIPKRSSDWIYRNLFQSRFSPKKVVILFFLPLIFFWVMWTAEFKSNTEHESINLGEEDAPEGNTTPKTELAQEQSSGNSPSLTPPTRPQLRTWTDTVAMFNGTTYAGKSALRGPVFIIACVIFGSLHFLAWPSEMPTRAERVIWRFAAIYLTAFPAFLFVAAVVLSCILGPALHGNNSDEIHFLVLVGYFLVAIFITAHPLIRAIVVVDSLALLRQLPETAYRDLEWSDVIPFL